MGTEEREETMSWSYLDLVGHIGAYIILPLYMLSFL